MSPPFVLVQLSDFHIGATWAGGDPVASLASAVASIRDLRPAPDALLITGDLSDHGIDPEYQQVVSLLDAIDAPRYALPGNHDDRDAVRRHFDLPGASATPVRYARDLGPLRLAGVVTSRPGADSGELDAGRLSWLADTLAADEATPTILAMHHPPLRTGAPGLDAVSLANGDRAALAELVGRHANIAAIVAGHVHRAIAGQLAHCRVLTAPATYAGFPLDFASADVEPVTVQPGYVVHLFCNGELVSHVETLRSD